MKLCTVGHHFNIYLITRAINPILGRGRGRGVQKKINIKKKKTEKKRSKGIKNIF